MISHAFENQHTLTCIYVNLDQRLRLCCDNSQNIDLYSSYDRSPAILLALVAGRPSLCLSIRIVIWIFPSKAVKLLVFLRRCCSQNLYEDKL